MTSDRERLQLLLGRLHDLERRLPLPHERAILDVARSALRQEVSRLAHALHDLRYTRPDISHCVAC